MWGLAGMLAAMPPPILPIRTGRLRRSAATEGGLLTRALKH
jgi:hypothetical protein